MRSEYFPGQRRNILALQRLFDQLGANNHTFYSSMDIAKILDNRGITYTELRANPYLLAKYRNTYIDHKNGSWHMDFNKGWDVNYRKAWQ